MHGAHPSDLVRPLDLDWLAALPDMVALVTLGPEQPRAVDAIGLLRERGVLVALGHSAATFEESWPPSTRAPARHPLLQRHAAAAPPHAGLVGAALSDDRLAVSLIADLVHVHPSALALAFRAKGPGGVALDHRRGRVARGHRRRDRRCTSTAGRPAWPTARWPAAR